MTHDPSNFDNNQIPEPNQENEESAANPANETLQQAHGAVKRKHKVLSIVLYTVLFAILAFLIVVLVWIIVDRCTSKSPVTSVFGYSFLIVETGSMSGTIEEGDVVVITKTNDYKIGDIITFLPEGDKIPTTHRIIRIVGDNIYTRGDANGGSEDPRPITYDNILGEVVYTIPNVGLFFRWFAQDFGWIYLVGIVAIIVIGVVLIKRIPSNKDEE